MGVRMADGSFYNDWRFTDNPFSPRPLKADDIGRRLLVGRDEELTRVGFRLRAGGGAVCLDGQVGVGKTSLANVAAYKAYLNFLEDKDRKPLLLPCRVSFQVSNDETAEQFRLRVLTEVAQTLIEKAANAGVKLQCEGFDGLNAWLNSPLIKQWSISFPVAGGGNGAQPNESAGFEQSGFIKAITSWLEVIFPEDRSGGVICVLDNLELLETSAMARKKIESLRDTLFTMRGLRWVLCGAHGIIQGVVSSQRLVGHLQEPLHIEPVALTQSQQVLEARINVFGLPGSVPYLPLTSDDFHRLYMIVHHNLRNTLAYSHDYCISVAEAGQLPSNDEEKTARFSKWLEKRARSIRDAVKSQLGPRAMELFHQVIRDFSGEFAPSDYEALGFQSVQAMRPHVKTLEEIGMVEAQHDDQDQRRKSISITGKGWIVHWAEVTS